MNDHSYRRQHLRAPLNSHVIYTYKNVVKIGMAINLSEGGMLLKHLPADLGEQLIYGVIAIPQFPVFSHLKHDEIKSFAATDFYKKIFRVPLSLKRNINSNGTSYVGASFHEIKNDAQIIISVYVKTFTKNIVFLLKSLENSAATKNIEQIRDVANLLGYNRDQKIAFLRQKVLHDYQSLQWL